LAHEIFIILKSEAFTGIFQGGGFHIFFHYTLEAQPSLHPKKRNSFYLPGGGVGGLAPKPHIPF